MIPHSQRKDRMAVSERTGKFLFLVDLTKLTSEDVSRPAASPFGNPTVPNARVILLFIVLGPRKTVSQTGSSLKIRGFTVRLEA